jgi:hypothetical protein
MLPSSPPTTINLTVTGVSPPPRTGRGAVKLRNTRGGVPPRSQCHRSTVDHSLDEVTQARRSSETRSQAVLRFGLELREGLLTVFSRHRLLGRQGLQVFFESVVTQASWRTFLAERDDGIVGRLTS